MPAGDPIVLPKAPHRSVAEEAANTVTHAIGLALSLAGAFAIGRAAPSLSLGTTWVCGLFVTTLIGLYTVSSCSHLVPRSMLQNRLRAWDQGAVYLLIAGTYTPFIWASLAFPGRAIGLSLLWCAAAAGFVSKVIAQHRVNSMRPRSYLLLGWLPAVFLFRHVPGATLFWMGAGGLSYTLGTLFLKADTRVPYFHATWHLFVVLGSACHFYAIYDFLMAPELADAGRRL